MVVGTIIPRSAVSYTLYTISTKERNPAQVASLAACLFSFCFDYLVRQKTSQPSLPMGPVYETPAPPPETFRGDMGFCGQPARDWPTRRVVELVYTSDNLLSFAGAVGAPGRPFEWNEERRFLLEAELNAAVFHAYGVGRTDAEFIMDSFPIVRRHDEGEHGEYRTKRVILEIYEKMAAAVRTGTVYVTPLDPAPAADAVRHGEPVAG